MVVRGVGCGRDEAMTMTMRTAWRIWVITDAEDGKQSMESTVVALAVHEDLFWHASSFLT